MTDDAELRARIEAQVAARRAGAASQDAAPGSDPEASAADVSPDADGEPLPGDTPISPRDLAPLRPWSQSSTDAPESPAGPPVTRGTPGRRGLGPVRPWLVSDSDDDAPATAAADPTPAPTPGSLQPARPWSVTPPTEPDKAHPSAPTPSNPDIVLRELAAEVDPTAVIDLGSQRPAMYVPDAAAVTAFAEAAASLLDEEQQTGGAPAASRRGRRRRDRSTESSAAEARHAVVPGETVRDGRPADDDPVEADDAPDSGDGAAADELPASAAVEPDVAADTEQYDTEQYPWQRRDAIDLDLHGAATWDPSMYPPEPEAPEGQRGRRAMRWLFARAPEPPVEQPPAAEPEPEPEPPATYEPEPAATYQPEAPVEPAPKASAKGRRFGRRPRVDEPAEDEADEQFELPAPDAAFEEPWLRSEPIPRPTRDWPRSPEKPPAGYPSRQGEAVESVDEPDHQDREPDAVPATSDAPEPVATPAVAAPPTLEPEREPAPALEPEPEPAPELEPEPEPEPEPELEPAAAPARRRPSPGPVATPAPPRRPSPGPSSAARSRRPRPGPVPSADATATGWPRMPDRSDSSGGISGATAPGARTSTINSTSQPDLARFLETAEPDDDDGDDGDDGDEKQRKGGGGRWRQVFVRGFIIVAVAAVAALLLRTWVVQPYYIPSASMEPTLHGCDGCNDDHVLVDKVSYRAHDVRAQDIVVFKRPAGVQVPDKVLIKRVIALAGDKISAKKGQIYVNGLAIEEPYLNKSKSCYASSPDENFAPRTVPKGDVFVMGDNRCNSTDSRDFGAIPTSSIVGRAFAIIWPLGRLRLL